MNLFLRLVACAISIATCSLAIGQELPVEQDQRELSFRLIDLNGNEFVLEKQDEKQLTVVCFLGTECPLARLYAGRLNQLSERFDSVDFVGVCSNLQDSLDDLKAYRDRQNIGIPLLRDNKNVVADQFEAERTPEVFVVDQDLKVLYRGRIDDQYQPGIAKSQPGRDDLAIALQESLANQAITISQTETVGCLIGRVKVAQPDDPTENTVTYTKQVSRILQNHCMECHRTGEIGPMELMDYDEVAGWAEMIVEVVDENRMPPWHADPKHGEFLNERRMTSSEKQMLRDWVAAGSPKGDLDDLPPAKAFADTSEWRLPREPDAVFEMRARPFTVPAEGTVEYQYFVVDPGFEEDKWVTAAEILPGERTVLHHSIVFIRPPDGDGFRGIGWLAAYVPGQSAPTFNPEFGRRIPAGSRLVFQQHYTPTGKQADDLTRIGLIFGEESKIKNEVFTLIALDQEFVIPPGASNHEVAAQFRWLPPEGELLGISPHMHYRGKSFELTASIDGVEETLLSVPNYDFNWQPIYQLKNPVPFSKIKSLGFSAAFDNSDQNPANPDPTEHVTWGDQTWEEMAIAFIMVAEPRVPTKADTIETNEPTAEELAKYEKLEKAAKKKAIKFADQYFERFDKNNDGVVTKPETPRSSQRYDYQSPDRNRDGQTTREEVVEAATYRYLDRQHRQDQADQN